MRTVDSQVLAQLSRLGRSFAVELHRPESPVVAPWQRFSPLLGNPEVLQARVTAVREALAQASGRRPESVDRRVAVSMAQLSVTARLMSPALAVASLSGSVLRLKPESLRWQPAVGSEFPLSIPSDALTDPGSTATSSGSAEVDPASTRAVELVDALGEVLSGPVRALVRACQTYALSPQVLWGNVASVLNGAASLIAAAEPSVAGRTWLIATRLLSRPPLRETSRDGPGPGFLRLSCCLMYRLAAGPIQPICGDCVLSRSSAPSCSD